MAKGISGEAIRQIGILFEAGTLGALSDRELLERFCSRDGVGAGPSAEHAFAALVERHGPMVLRVCRQILRDEHAAHDAFQATFLVLVRKARTLRAQESLGGWLHGVACRVAACDRDAAVRRRTHEKRAAEMSRSSEAEEATSDRDVGALLQTEIGRLPAAFRAVVVLCDLEGLTQEEAAKRLGCPSGTVRSRLARGRGRLRVRWLRKGLAPSAVAFAQLPVGESAAALGAVPAALAEAAVLAVAGRTLAGTVPAALSKQVVKGLLMTKLHWTAVGLLTIGLGVGAGETIMTATAQNGPPDQEPAATAPSVPDAPKPPESHMPTKADNQASTEENEIALAAAQRKRAEDRLAWSNRMFAKGYLSKAQVVADKLDLQRAVNAHEKALAKQKPGEQNVPTPKLGPNIDNDPEPTLKAADLNRLASRSEFAETEHAGLPPNTALATLDWAKAYAMAEGRCLDPALKFKTAAPSEQDGLFKAFCDGFRGEPEGATAPQELVSEIFDLLMHRQRVDNARWNVAACENLVTATTKLIKISSRDISQLELDEVSTELEDARLHLAAEQENYRDRIEALKVRLGLAPGAPLALDPKVLAGFRDAFEALDRWSADPQREMDFLPRIATSLPVLEDMVIDGHSVASGTEHPDELEALLSAAVGMAFKRQTADVGEAIEARAVSLEQKVRREIRGLIRIRKDYEIERRRLVLVTRRRDQAQEQFLAPRRVNPSETNATPHAGAGLVAELTDTQGELLACEDKLVSLWTEYQKLQLVLFHDLGTFPFHNWTSFYEHFTATGEDAESRPTSHDVSDR